MKTITSITQLSEIAGKMFSSDSAILSVNIETSWGLVTAFRNGSFKMTDLVE